MNLRLRVLTQPAISSKSNYVLVGTDSEFKAQVFTTFNPNVEIDDEFSITKATVEFKGTFLKTNKFFFLKFLKFLSSDIV